MGGVKILDRAEGVGPGGFIEVFIEVSALLLRCFITHQFSSHVHGGEVDIEKGWVCSVVTLQLVHILKDKLEHGWSSDIGRFQSTEL